MNDRQRLWQEASKRWPGHGPAWMKCTTAEIQTALDTGVLPEKVSGASAASPAVGGDLAALIALAIQQYMPPQEQALDTEAITALVKTELASLNIQEQITEMLKAVPARQIVVTCGDVVTKVNTDEVHSSFDEMMELVQEGHNNLMMVGPAGSGKTTMAHSIATAMGLPFDFLSLTSGVTETHLLGRVLPQKDGSWQYQMSAFVRIYEGGGIFLLDEVDAADANLMVAINAALANGVLSNPITGQQHKRHPKTIIVAAANTWGNGGDCQYVGRNQLDAATLDRFVLATLYIDYDTTMERRLVRSYLAERENDAIELLSWVESLRKGIASNRLRRVASTRLVISAARAMSKGRSLAKLKARYYRSWSNDEKAKIERSY